MAVSAGSHTIGADRDRLILRTRRDGLAAQAGHDLMIEITRWSGELTVGDDHEPKALRASIDMTSLAVREGSGGIKPLTDRDRREIAVTARKVLGSDRNPEATFEATTFEPGDSGGGTISGTLTLAGRSQPVRVQVGRNGEDRYQATATIAQTQFGIRPYAGFFGALKVSDAVSVAADVDLSRPAGAP